LSSSGSISSSPKERVSGWPQKLADPFGSAEVGKTKDVEEFDARRGLQGYGGKAEGGFHLLEGHGRKPSPRL
jgi:hypothetical protein